MKFACLPAVLAMLAAAPAIAAPEYLPARDVAVVYQLNAPGAEPMDYQLRYDASGERARVSSPELGFFVLADLPAGQAEVVLPALHAIVQAPDFSDIARLIANADQARFTPLGAGFYAGRACEKYLVLNTQGSATACITQDGVILHLAGQDSHGSAEVTALSVDYAPQPAGVFAVPPDFTAITLPPGALAALLRPQ